MKKRHHNWLTAIIILTILLIVSMLTSLCLGEINFSPDKIVHLFNVSAGENTEAYILQQIRFPRVLLALIVGGSLSLSGVILQGIFRNPLVEPYTLGISGGASVGTSLVIVLSLQGMWGGLFLPIAGFAGALGTIFLVYLFGIKRGNIRIHTLLLTGVMISFITSSLLMLIMALSKSEDLQGIVFWMMGSLNRSNPVTSLTIAVIAVVVLISSYLYSPALNAMRLGHEQATQLGINTKKSIKILFILTSLLTGICVSIAGVIGFVGLIIPQLIRYWVGSDFRILLITSFLGGGIFLILSDLFARTILSPNELPIGVITGIIGGILFIIIMGGNKSERRIEQ